MPSFAARCRSLVGLILSCASAAAWPGFTDGAGREWRQVSETTGLSWSDLASACAAKSDWACSGAVHGIDLGGWRWASSAQVTELFNRILLQGRHLPANAVLSDEAAAVSAQRQHQIVSALLTAQLRPTYHSAAGYASNTGLLGLTSSLDSALSPVLGSIGLGNTGVTIEGRFALHGFADVDARSDEVGAWLWRAATASAPGAVTPVAEPGAAWLWMAGLPVLLLGVARRPLRLTR